MERLRGEVGHTPDPAGPWQPDGQGASPAAGDSTQALNWDQPVAPSEEDFTPAETVYLRPARAPLIAVAVLALAALVGSTVTVAFSARGRAAPLPGVVRSSHAGIAYFGTLTGDLAGPLAVAVGPDGDVFVTDTENGRVRRFDGISGLPKETIGRKAGMAPGPGELVHPVGLALDETGRLYVSDNVMRRISVFDATGRFAGYFAEDGEGRRPFGTPGSLFHRGGILYISDLAEHRVMALRRDGTVYRVLGGGRGPEPGQLVYPGSTWVDDAGTVFVADPGNQRVQVFDPAGALVRTLADPVFNLPRGIARDAAGRLYVSSTLGHFITVFSPDGTAEFSYGSSGSEWNELGFPTGIAIAAGRLFVADRANNRVQVFLLSG